MDSRAPSLAFEQCIAVCRRLSLQPDVRNVLAVTSVYRRQNVVRRAGSANVEQLATAAEPLCDLWGRGQCPDGRRDLCALRTNRFSLSRESFTPPSPPRARSGQLAPDAAWRGVSALRPYRWGRQTRLGLAGRPGH